MKIQRRGDGGAAELSGRRRSMSAARISRVFVRDGARRKFPRDRPNYRENFADKFRCNEITYENTFEYNYLFFTFFVVFFFVPARGHTNERMRASCAVENNILFVIFFLCKLFRYALPWLRIILINKKKYTKKNYEFAARTYSSDKLIYTRSVRAYCSGAFTIFAGNGYFIEFYILYFFFFSVHRLLVDSRYFSTFVKIKPLGRS